MTLSEIIIIWAEWKLLSFWTKQVVIWWRFKGLIVAQPIIWSSCCLMKSQRRDKMSKIAILWLFWAYVGQPDGIFWRFFFHFISMQHSKFWWLLWFLAQNNICLNICNTVYNMCLIISDNFRAKPNQAWASEYSSWNQAEFMYINKKQFFTI